MRNSRAGFVVGLLLFAFCRVSFAATYTWQAVNGNWTDASNWSPSTATMGTNDAAAVGVSSPLSYINTLGSGGTVEISKLTVGNATTGSTATLNINATTLKLNVGAAALAVNMGGILDVQSGGVLLLTPNTNGTAAADIGPGGLLKVTGGIFSNAGTSGSAKISVRGGTVQVTGGSFVCPVGSDSSVAGRKSYFEITGGVVRDVNSQTWSIGGGVANGGQMLFHLNGGTFSPVGPVRVGNLYGNNMTPDDSSELMVSSGYGVNNTNLLISTGFSSGATIPSSITNTFRISGGSWLQNGGLYVGSTDVKGSNHISRLLVENGRFDQVGLAEMSGVTNIGSSTLLEISGGTYNQYGTMTVGNGNALATGVDDATIHVVGGLYKSTNTVTLGGTTLGDVGRLTVDGGQMTVASAGNAVLKIGTNTASLGKGIMTLNGGLLEVDRLVAKGGTNTTIAFNGGLMKVRTADIAISNGVNVLSAIIGDGNVGNGRATLQLTASLSSTVVGGLVVTNDGGFKLMPDSGYVSPTLIGDVTFVTNSEFLVNLSSNSETNGGTAGIDWDKLNVTGNAILGGGTLMATLNSGTAEVGDKWTVLQTSGAISGDFGSYSLTGGGVGTCSGSVVGGNKVVLEVVTIPEPSVMALLGLGLAMTVVVIRRRRK